MAQAALAWADEVILVMPEAFPHKKFEGVSQGDRCRMLRLLAESADRYSAATTAGGLYIEMADEARAALGPDPEIRLTLGRDAAERIAHWDYGRPGVFEEMIARYPLLVAERAGRYEVADEHQEGIFHVDLPGSFDDVSSTEVRRRIESGEPWRDLVPAAIVELVTELYGPDQAAAATRR